MPEPAAVLSRPAPLVSYSACARRPAGRLHGPVCDPLGRHGLHATRRVAHGLACASPPRSRMRPGGSHTDLHATRRVAATELHATRRVAYGPACDPPGRRHGAACDPPGRIRTCMRPAWSPPRSCMRPAWSHTDLHATPTELHATRLVACTHQKTTPGRIQAAYATGFLRASAARRVARVDQGRRPLESAGFQLYCAVSFETGWRGSTV